MNPLFLRAAFVAFLLSACSAPFPTPRGGDLDGASTTPVARLQRDDGRTTAIHGTIPTGESDPQRAADVFLDLHGDNIGVDDASDSLRVRETRTHPSTSGDDETTVVYDGEQDGHRVYGSEVRVVVRNGEVVYAGGNVVEDDSPLGEAAFDADRAFAIFDGSTPESWVREGQELVAFNLGVLIRRPTRSVLTWMLDVRDGFHPWRIFLNAQTGEEVVRFPRFAHARSSETYSFDGVTGFETEDAILTHVDGMLVEGVTASADAIAADAFVGTIYDYFNDVFGRDSYDGAGATIQTYVDMVGLQNATWNGVSLNFDPIYLSLDVMGHEFTHAVVTHTADLEYVFESGALNESYADILGEFAAGETSWTIGELTPNGTLRSFSDPAAYDQPAHFRHRFGFGSFDACDAETPCAGGETCITNVCVGEDYDHGGVHFNSGITNHAIYLLVEGGTSAESGIEVAGIGRDKVQHLVYRALQTALGATSDFEDFRFSLRTTAMSFIEKGEHGFTYEDCGSVLNAMAAVGIGEPDRDLDCFDDEIDNCPCVHNPEQNEDDCDDNAECGTQCNLYRTCGECALDDGCGWCDDACQATNAEPMCSGGAFEECEDDTCDSFGSCGDCNHDDGCGWCEGFCQSDATECLGDDGRSVPYIHEALCPLVDCPAEETCGDCTASGCTWCDGACTALANECRQEAPATCDPVDCTTGSDCESCTAIAGCGWGDDGCVAAGTAGSFTDISLCSCGSQGGCESCTLLGCAWEANACSARGTAAATTNPALCEPTEDRCDAVDCMSCTQTPGCGWGSMGCVEAMPGTPGVATRAAECYDCSGLMDCTSCATNGFCEWCPGRGCSNTYAEACAMPTPVLDCN